MQKLLFGIFAHPDDEAFGPVGTLLQEVASGTKLHLIVLTAGENGANPDSHDDLGAVRLQEWQEAGALIGATGMHHFNYIDGTLGNQNHVEITQKIIDLVHATATEGDEIEFMSLDLNGITGHIDHIVAGRSACLAFCRLRDQGLPMRRIRLACLSQANMPVTNTDYVYMEPGHEPHDIHEVIDAREYTDKIHEIMQKHHTQRSDYASNVALRGEQLGIDQFIVKD